MTRDKAKGGMTMSSDTRNQVAEESIALTFFTDLEARTVEAIAERIIPQNGEEAGATQAGVVYYIDRTITGFGRELQRVYRLGLRALQRYCEQSYSMGYLEMTPEIQDEVVRTFLGAEVREEQEADLDLLPVDPANPGSTLGSSSLRADAADVDLLVRLFGVVREHTVEGFFCDPIYGGNRNCVGWKLVGFPGAQWGYTAREMKPGFDASGIAIKTLSDLRRQLDESRLPNNEAFWSNEENEKDGEQED
jgi:gluconate 2-dehydrogenase gamma chain